MKVWKATTDGDNLLDVCADPGQLLTNVWEIPGSRYWNNIAGSFQPTLEKMLGRMDFGDSLKINEVKFSCVKMTWEEYSKFQQCQDF